VVLPYSPSFTDSRASDKPGAIQIGVGCEYDDVLREWTTVREIGYDGALLVRPDHHVGWRCAQLLDDPETALRHALTSLLHRAQIAETCVDARPQVTELAVAASRG
jgi:2,4-dichlorophenol 6-monooxygenase